MCKTSVFNHISGMLYFYFFVELYFLFSNSLEVVLCPLECHISYIDGLVQACSISIANAQ